MSADEMSMQPRGGREMLMSRGFNAAKGLLADAESPAGLAASSIAIDDAALSFLHGTRSFETLTRSNTKLCCLACMETYCSPSCNGTEVRGCTTAHTAALTSFNRRPCHACQQHAFGRPLTVSTSSIETAMHSGS